MAQVSREAMVELLQTVNKTQSMQIDEQTKTIRELRELVAELRGTIANLEETVTNSSENFLAVPVRSFLQKKRQKKMLLPESARGRKRLR